MDEVIRIVHFMWVNGAEKWEESLRSGQVVPLYKNKGDRSDCNNYRGISLLSIVGKVFARVVLGRLQILAATVYPEAQCGFRSERSTIDMTFCNKADSGEMCRTADATLHCLYRPY